MRLLITRPEQDAMPLKAQLIGMGHEVLVEPLLQIELHALEGLDPDEIQALIATSRNALRAVASSPQLDELQRVPLFTVGPGTGSTAQALGFQSVLEGPRDSEALVTLIALRAEVNAGPLVYLAGDVIAADVAGELRRLGFHVMEPVVYSARTADSFSPQLCERFQSKEIDGVLLMSPRTARTYVKLLRKHSLTAAVKNTVHFCLSPAVALGLADAPELHVKTASAPNLNEMLALIARTTPQFD